MISKKQLVEQVTKKLVDEGKLIEAGWQGLRIMSVPDDAPQVQIDEMRSSFFAGAQHLFGSIMTFLDSGDEPTAADLKRMDLIQAELEQFIRDFNKKHGLENSATQ